MTYAEIIREKLTVALAPSRLEVVDQSSRHEGHAGSRPEGETHFAVTVASAAFEGRSRIERQREVYKILAKELKEHVHALAVTALTPNEDDRRA